MKASFAKYDLPNWERIEAISLSIYLSIYAMQGSGRDVGNLAPTGFLQPHGLPVFHMVFLAMEIRCHVHCNPRS